MLIHRPKHKVLKRSARWIRGPLGLSFRQDPISKQVLVSRVSNPHLDMKKGDVLTSINGKQVEGDNWPKLFQDLLQQHALGRIQFLEFESAPPPIQVRKVQGVLHDAGVEKGCALIKVNQHSVQYVPASMLLDSIAELPKPCTLTFVKPKTTLA